MGERKGREAFDLLTRHGDYAVLMTPWKSHLRQTFLSTVADWSSLSSSLSHRSHRPHSGLPRNNKRHIAWATIATHVIYIYVTYSFALNLRREYVIYAGNARNDHAFSAFLSFVGQNKL